MDDKQFRDTLSDSAPPAGFSNPAKALWAVAKRDWQRAEAYLKGDNSKDAAWVRAHMHRCRGDHDSAAEWYGKADRPPAGSPLDEELSTIAAGLVLHYG